MKRRAALAFLIVALTSACADLSRWQHFYHSGQEAEKQGDWRLANDLYAQSIQDAKTFGVKGKDYLPAVLSLAKKQDTPELWREAVDTGKAAGDKAAVASSYNELALCIYRKNRYERNDEIDAVASEYLQYVAGHFPHDTRQYADALWMKADTDGCRNPAEDIKLIDTVESIYRKEKASDSRQMSLSCFAERRADEYAKLGDRKAAIAEYERAIKLAAGTMFERGSHRKYMRFLDASGMKAAALKEYKEYVKDPERSPGLPLPLPTYDEALHSWP